GEAYRAALADFQAIGARLGAANTLSSMGQLALVEGRKVEADQLLAQAVNIYKAIGSRYSVPAQIGNYAWTLLRVGRKEEARPYFLQAAELFDEIGFHDYADRNRRAAGA
ncbi:MAG: hypothetical protein IAE85_12315, partial [Anaerolinea sp.]|nr:hypothetical protein [Anaerolinea sp.]